MGRWQVHRGPDAWGERVSDGVALGHNRLSIIDLATGHQPMTSVCGSVTTVFNGEIYNYRSLWSELQAAGFSFGTDHSDTEVVLNGYLCWGDEVFGRLDGMFAVALWDARDRKLVMARDRIGIKPLYYAPLARGGVAFASEPKAIVGSRIVVPELRQEGVAEYLLFRAPHQCDTLFGGVHKLPAGHTLRWSAAVGLGRPIRYWHPTVAVPFASDTEALQAADEALSCAVESHLISDVPVGSFLSGGVDSSLVTAMASRRRAIDAFTIGSDSVWDETEFAKSVASHLRVPLHVRRVTGEDFLSYLDDWQYVNDDPCADPSALALMLLSEFARDSGMKVMLAGEGSDELCGGYNAYSRFVSLTVVRSVPGSRLLSRPFLERMNPRSRDYMSIPTSDYLGTGHLTDLRLLSRLLLPERSGDVLRVMDLCRSEVPGASAIRRAQDFDRRVRLPDDLLMRTDRASMYFSVEARVPFLDNHVVDFSLRLTDSQLIGSWARSSKRIIKQLAERYVPRSAIYRPKRGFDLPVADWLRQQFMPMLDSLAGEALIPCLRYSTVRQLLDRLRAGEDSRAGVVWAWFVLERWHRLWVVGPAQPRCPRAIRDLAGYQALCGSE
jgi:asparagine synthase (glutamine-hydrolysing)